jgi:hypothetical protein
MQARPHQTSLVYQTLCRVKYWHSAQANKDFRALNHSSGCDRHSVRTATVELVILRKRKYCKPRPFSVAANAIKFVAVFEFLISKMMSPLLRRVLWDSLRETGINEIVTLNYYAKRNMVLEIYWLILPY